MYMHRVTTLTFNYSMDIHGLITLSLEFTLYGKKKKKKKKKLESVYRKTDNTMA